MDRHLALGDIHQDHPVHRDPVGNHQDRPDRGDRVLKLLSGYVPAHELRVPLLTAMTEIAEELLIESEAGWLQGRYQDTWLPTPYADSLPLNDEHYFALGARSGAARPVLCRELIARLDTQRPELFLAEYRDGMPTGELFCLQQGELIAQPTEDQLLSEAFAPRQGWLVAASNCPLRS